jgi:hypothetical protein
MWPNSELLEVGEEARVLAGLGGDFRNRGMASGEDGVAEGTFLSSSHGREVGLRGPRPLLPPPTRNTLRCVVV